MVPFERDAPTIYLNFDGALHVGKALVEKSGQVVLDTARTLFEFAPLLGDLLEPYPRAQIVLTAAWLKFMQTGEINGHLPSYLVRRIVTCSYYSPCDLLCVSGGTARPDEMIGHACSNAIDTWLVLHDGTFAVPANNLEHFLLVQSTTGLGSLAARRRLQSWLWTYARGISEK
ncbi:HAD domain-containing protein [Paraburkholderia fungorum]|uniref:HAD domain-containing protein n=1 Tax=Paraburkholderia fungorum TaxID=134537 RepID=UPI0038BB6ACF